MHASFTPRSRTRGAPNRDAIDGVCDVLCAQHGDLNVEVLPDGTALIVAFEDGNRAWHFTPEGKLRPVLRSV